MEAHDFTKEIIEAAYTEELAEKENAARAEKIQNLKTMIRAGLYDVSSTVIARSLIESLGSR